MRGHPPEAERTLARFSSAHFCNVRVNLRSTFPTITNRCIRISFSTIRQMNKWVVPAEIGTTLDRAFRHELVIRERIGLAYLSCNYESLSEALSTI